MSCEYLVQPFLGLLHYAGLLIPQISPGQTLWPLPAQGTQAPKEQSLFHTLPLAIVCGTSIAKVKVSSQGISLTWCSLAWSRLGGLGHTSNTRRVEETSVRSPENML